MARPKRGGSSSGTGGGGGHKSAAPLQQSSKPKATDTQSNHSSSGTNSTSSSVSASASNSSNGPSNGGAGSSAGLGLGKGKPHSHSKKRASFSLSSKLILDKWKTLIGCVCLAVASYFGYLGYLETRVNTPFDNQKMVQRTGLDDPERYWGSYRPLNYFGLKTRDPHSLVMGLMWYTPANLRHGGEGIRHWCDQADNLDKYGWTHHDGRSFGVQEIHDLPFELKTSFVKLSAGKQFGGDWTARISVRNYTNAWDRRISLVWYVALDERTKGLLKYARDEQSAAGGVIYGETEGLGEFRLGLHPVKGRVVHQSHLSSVAPSLNKLKETVFAHMRMLPDAKGNRHIGLPGEMVSRNGEAPEEPNLIAIHITADVDFTLDIAYQSTSGYSVGEQIPQPPTGREYTELLQQRVAEFERRFEDTFELRAKGFSPDEIRFARFALSNMIGGIGYFYGASRVQSVYTKSAVPYWRSALYTAVPSRSFFPRGFLWDEGFHGLVLAAWDLDIELDILCHWFDLLNVEGWIPREQILGPEALAKVPEEFVIQRNTNANPPTFFLTLKKILNRYRTELTVKGRLATLERLYPRLQTWFAWYNTTQRGDILGSYRWRGRNESATLELNPKTLTSGLDDYPRASHPSPRERHVDLRCWIGFAAHVMGDLSSLLGKDDSKYYETAAYLADNQLLNEQHLSPFTESYADWGLHTDSVLLKRSPAAKQTARYHGSAAPPPPADLVRVTLKEPDYKFVDSTFGYVNLFPFLLETLDHDSPYLGRILQQMRDPQVLWTDYGLRSLSKGAPLYMKRNTEHDPPYWRGPIWININYLALKALRHYGKVEGPHAAEARRIYDELRENVVRNVFREYQRTGYLWEQYDDTSGQGKGCRPFTGWTSLVVLIMAEQY